MNPNGEEQGPFIDSDRSPPSCRMARGFYEYCMNRMLTVSATVTQELKPVQGFLISEEERSPYVGRCLETTDSQISFGVW